MAASTNIINEGLQSSNKSVYFCINVNENAHVQHGEILIKNNIKMINIS